MENKEFPKIQKMQILVINDFLSNINKIANELLRAIYTMIEEDNEFKKNCQKLSLWATYQYEGICDDCFQEMELTNPNDALKLLRKLAVEKTGNDDIDVALILLYRTFLIWGINKIGKEDDSEEGEK